MVTYQTHRKYLFVKTTVGGEQEYSLFDKNIEGSPKTHFEKQNSQKIPDFDLPEKLERNQLKDPKFIDGLFFVRFLKFNMNNPVESEVQRSGVLYAEPNDTVWRVFFEVVDNGNRKNNPYLFWKENEEYFAVLVDANGAGSGEGIGKLIDIDYNSKSWTVIDCFYFNPDSFYDHITYSTDNVPLSQTIIAYNNPFEYFKEHNGSYVFDASINKFTLNGNIEEGCTSFNLMFP